MSTNGKHHKRSQSNQSSSSSISLSNTLYQSLSIKLDIPVTSLSTSPSGHQVVLAAKRGLYIVDLNKPFDPPLTLHHLTKWEVVDVQWCPHKSNSHWIASTSNQKALIWNLNLLGTSNQVEFVLGKHTRAVSDMHWSPFHPFHLATCSYDAFIHVWDLRDGSHRKPTQSFCAWTLGANQVKFNRVNEYLLASAHDTDVRVWDTRKGSSPVTIITAHGMKISGLDWSHHNERQLLTCSQDKTVKLWDVLFTRAPQAIIQTGNAVYRARFTPFGNGVLTMSQRKDNSLYLWSLNDLSSPVGVFSGHDDTPLEFVWRFQGERNSTEDRREFQLVTWSKDHQLRLWPISMDIYQKLGHVFANTRSSVDSRASLNCVAAEDSDDSTNAIRDELSRLFERFPNVKLESSNEIQKIFVLSVNYRENSVSDAMNLRISIDLSNGYCLGNVPHFDVLDNDVLPLAKRTIIGFKLQRIARNWLTTNGTCLAPCFQYLMDTILPSLYVESIQSSDFGSKKKNDVVINPSNLGTEESDSDSSDLEAKRDDRYMIASMPKAESSLKGQKDIVSGQNIQSSNTPYPALCGARFGITGELICFFSTIPHPSSTQFTTYTLTARNQKPILQSHAFSSQPKTYALFDGYISYLATIRETGIDDSETKDKRSSNNFTDVGPKKLRKEGEVSGRGVDDAISLSQAPHTISSQVPQSFFPDVPLSLDISPSFSRLRRKSIASSSSSVEKEDHIHHLGIPYSTSSYSSSLSIEQEDNIAVAQQGPDPDSSTKSTLANKMYRRPRLSAVESSPTFESLILQDFAFPADQQTSPDHLSTKLKILKTSSIQEKSMPSGPELKTCIRMWDLSWLSHQNTDLIKLYKFEGDASSLCHMNSRAAAMMGRHDLAQCWSIVGHVISARNGSNSNTSILDNIFWNTLSDLESMGDCYSLAAMTIVAKSLWASDAPLTAASVHIEDEHIVTLSHVKSQYNPSSSLWSHFKIIDGSGIAINASLSHNIDMYYIKPRLHEINDVSILPELVTQKLVMYIHLLSDALLSKGLFQKRLEILRGLGINDGESTCNIQTGVCCAKCRNEMSLKKGVYFCSICNIKKASACVCSICRIPTGQLAQICMVCNHGGHLSHISTWFSQNSECPTGCGCSCVFHVNS